MTGGFVPSLRDGDFLPIGNPALRGRAKFMATPRVAIATSNTVEASYIRV
jgi:hypothetical protein